MNLLMVVIYDVKERTKTSYNYSRNLTFVFEDKVDCLEIIIGKADYIKIKNILLDPTYKLALLNRNTDNETINEICNIKLKYNIVYKFNERY